jgi:hypothetical protein
MVELDGERVLEEIPPERRVHEQPRSFGHERSVDQRPRVVDVPGAQSGDEGAEINLQEHES